MTKEWNEVLCEELEINVEELVAKVNETSLVFEDSYGSGVCLVDGKSYKNYTELAKDFNIEILEFTV